MTVPEYIPRIDPVHVARPVKLRLNHGDMGTLSNHVHHVLHRVMTEVRTDREKMLYSVLWELQRKLRKKLPDCKESYLLKLPVHEAVVLKWTLQTDTEFGAEGVYELVTLNLILTRIDGQL